MHIWSWRTDRQTDEQNENMRVFFQQKKLVSNKFVCTESLTNSNKPLILLFKQILKSFTRALRQQSNSVSILRWSCLGFVYKNYEVSAHIQIKINFEHFRHILLRKTLIVYQLSKGALINSPWKRGRKIVKNQ